MPVEPYLLVLYTVALASLTRLVTHDELLERPIGSFVGAMSRLGTWATRYFDDRRWSMGWFTAGAFRFAAWFVSKVLTCPWCASFWLAVFVVVPAMWWHGHNPIVLFAATAFAMRFVAGFLVDR